MQVITFGAGTGNGFTITEGNWYLTGLFTGGSELNRLCYFSRENENLLIDWQLKPVVTGQLSMGDNTDSCFMGIVSYYRPGLRAVNTLDASSYRFRMALVAGIRIDEPGFLKKKKK